ncbi:hypothetical protein GCM10009865_47500 [Aeromicrobium ponti]|uniref:Cell division protein FtsL n=1 Tax=Cytobacillus oceanisediminis TaxID=665099 RepID=A0A562JCY2_9BACI|nr:DUF2681 domain-containing protein [Cytobacillus oceanisediminis]TWH81007.1 hypothetical protein IQ19_04424 [Cytobacillus oceanisediminis]
MIVVISGIVIGIVIVFATDVLPLAKKYNNLVDENKELREENRKLKWEKINLENEVRTANIKTLQEGNKVLSLMSKRIDEKLHTTRIDK